MIITVIILAAILPFIAGDICGDTQCPEGATCVESFGCKCAAGKILASDLTKCLDVAYDGYGAPCEDNSQCSARLEAGGICSASCQCKGGYHYLHGQCWRSAGLGVECNRDEDCFAHSDYDSMACKEGVCACGERSYQRDSTTCRRVAAVGEACDLDDDCQVDDLTCNNNTYTCQSKGQSQALVETILAYGPTLEPSATDCPGNNTELNPAGVCVCVQGSFTMSAGEEDCVRELGECCNTTYDCAPLEQVVCRQSASRETKICACNGGYAPSSSNRQCVKSRKYDFNCQEDAMCSYYGGVCASGKCQCPEGYRYLEEYVICWPTRSLGEPCTNSTDCAVASGEGVACEDKLKLCQCVEGYHTTSDNDCWPDAKDFQSKCKEDADCPFGSTATCNGGVCACQQGSFQSVAEDATPACFPGVGATCESHENCSAVLNATCQTECVEMIPGSCFNVSTCTCPEGQVGSEDLTTCLPVAETLGGSCKVQAQCAPTLGPTACAGDECVCAQDHHFRSDRCWETRVLGQRCNRTAECFLAEDMSRAVCLNNVCACGYEWAKAPDSDQCQSVPGQGIQPTAAVTIFSLIFWTLLARLM